jgi:ribosomal protein L40E
MKKAILFGLLAVLWLVLKLLLRWFGTPRIGNPAADLALLLVVTAAAILVGVLLMKTEKSADAQKKAKPQADLPALAAALTPANAPPPAVSAPPHATVETGALSAVPGDARNLTCPACGAAARGGKFCEACGHELQRRTACRQCGARLADAAKFCRECGAQVA